MKIVVIGKNGQIGEALQKTCDKSVTLYGFNRDELDITKKTKASVLLSKLKPDIVINTAAYHVIDLCEKKPREAFLINSIAVKNLATICKKLHCTFVTYSTDYVFDGRKNTPYTENDRPNPLQTYGLSKLAGEYAALNEYPEKTYIIRTNGVYGGSEGSRSKGGNFILNLLKDFSQNDQVAVGTNYFANPTSAKSIAKATFALLASNATPGVYHLASEGYCSWYDFSKMVVQHTKWKKTVIPVQSTSPDSIQRPLFSVLSNTKAKKIGITLPSVAESLEEYMKELKKSGKF